MSKDESISKSKMEQIISEFKEKFMKDETSISDIRQKFEKMKNIVNEDDVNSKIIEEACEKSTKMNENFFQREYGRYVDPLRRNIDYQSTARKTFLVTDLGFSCEKCGFYNNDVKYVHSEEECVLHKVMNS